MDWKLKQIITAFKNLLRLMIFRGEVVFIDENGNPLRLIRTEENTMQGLIVTLDHEYYQK